MTLRQKLLLLAAVTVLALVVSLHLVARSVLLERFSDLEKDEALQDLARARNILDFEILNLKEKTGDYAAWDDTYEFARKPTGQYIRSNFEDTTFDILRLNFILVYNDSGRRIFSKGYDLAERKAVELPASFFQVLESEDGVLIRPRSPSDEKAGLILPPAGSAMVAVMPILTSRKEGPQRGCVVFGRYVGPDAIRGFSNLTGLPVDVRSLEDPKLPGDFREAAARLTRQEAVLFPVSETLLRCYTLHKDVFGRDEFILEVDVARNVYEHGQTLLNRLLVLLAGLGLLFGLIVAFLIERNVLTRIRHLSSEVDQVGSSGDLSKRITLAGSDELSRVSTAVNRMLTDLENAQQRYRAVVEGQSELIARCKPDGTLTFCNEAYARRWKRSVGDLVGRKVQDLIPFDDERKAFLAHLAGMANRRPMDSLVSRELPARDADGRLEWYHWTDQAIFDPQERVIEVQMVGRSITKRKLAEEALRQSEMRFRAIIQDQTEMICRYRPDGTLTFVNEPYCRSWNRPEAELIGKNILELIPDEEGRKKFSAYLATFPKFTPQNPVHINEVSTLRPDGSPCWLQWTDRAIFDAGGKLAEIQAVGHDITARKEADLKIRGAEQRYRAVLEDQTEMICRFKPDGTMILVNSAYARFFGKKIEELVGRKYAPEVHPDDLKHVEAMVASMSPANPILVIENRVIAAGRAVRWTQWTNRAFFDDHGRAVEYQAVGRDVTDQRRVEAELRSSEERYRSLVNNIPDVTWRSDRSGNTLFISPNVQSITGFSAGEYLGGGPDLWFGKIHAEDRDRVQTAYELLFAKGWPYDLEYRIQRKDGGWIWVHDRSIATGEVDGVRYADGIFSDITARKKMESERNRLASILEATTDLVGIATTEGTQLYLNSAGRRMLGLRPGDDVSGTPIAAAHPSWAYEIVKNKGIPTAIRDGVWSGETALQRPDGTEIPVTQMIIAHKSSSGTVEYLSTIVRDMTTQLKAEEELVRLSAAIEHAAEAVVITDLDANIQYVNPAFEKVSGYTRAEVMGKNPRILRSGKHGEAYYKRMWETLKAGEVWTGDFINKRKDGTLFHEEGSISPLRTPSGKIFGFVAVKRDVTRQVQIESELRQAQKMEAIGQLAGGIAHDFNNMLASIMGYAKLASDELSKDSEVYDDLQQIMKAGRRGKELVEQMLAFSRQSGVKGQTAPQQLGDIVKEAMKLIRPSLPSNILIEVKLPDHLPFVLIDPIEYHQVIVNLCINSSQAMPGGGKLTVELRDQTVSRADQKQLVEGLAGGELVPGRYVVLSVEDTGCGIPKAVLPRIFEPFFTTRKKGQGTGMGLAMVYGIVTHHHGAIHVYTEEGKGTTMRIYLPTSETAPIQRPDPKPDKAGGDESILVVDDEEPLAKMVGKTLTRLGYRVTVKTSSTEALELIQKSPDQFDLVVSDQTMPGLTGDKLAEQIRKIRPDIPVILCSGFSEVLTPEREKEIRVDKLVRKPFVDDELEIEIRRLLDRRKR